MAKWNCKHPTPRWVLNAINVGVAHWCPDCGAMLSLGPSNDEPEEVKVEIRAAELEAVTKADDWFMPVGFDINEDFGWFEHEERGDSVHVHKRLAGYLARELATHDDRETRDADAWPWDPSRAVAGQWELSQRVKVASDALDVHMSARIAMDAALKAEEWKQNAPVREAARKFNALIAASSVGAGLANIEANGIDAELVDLSAEIDAEADARMMEVLDEHDMHPRAAGCECHHEEGDSPCPVHPSSDDRANADGDPPGFAAERTAEAIAVEDALRAGERLSDAFMARTADMEQLTADDMRTVVGSQSAGGPNDEGPDGGTWDTPETWQEAERLRVDQPYDISDPGSVNPMSGMTNARMDEVAAERLEAEITADDAPDGDA